MQTSLLSDNGNLYTSFRATDVYKLRHCDEWFI